MLRGGDMETRPLKKLFEPIKIGGLELKNRIKMPAMVIGMIEKDGSITNRMKAFYTERARGGVALMGMTCSPTKLILSHMLSLYDDRFVPDLMELTRVCHDNGAKVYAQLGVGYSWAFGDSPVKFISPSGITATGRPGTPFRLGGPLEATMPETLSIAEIHQMVESYGDAAKRARQAGFDAVEFIASVGYTISQFLSPLTNKRTDEYGGSLKNRMRFLLEIIDNATKKAGKDYTFTCRISGADLLDEEGYSLEDTKSMAIMLEESGIDELDVMAGWHNARVPMIQQSVPQGAWVYLAEAIKKTVRIPVAAGTQIQDPVIAEQVLEQDKADMVYMARALIADPELPNKAKLGCLGDIRPCINCCRCMEAVDSPPVPCSVNARMGRETEFPDGKSSARGKSVLVIGSGPAGMEAARVAATRGHQVTLWEAGTKLGGNLLLATIPPHKQELECFLKYLVNQLQLLEVKIEMEKHARVEDIIKGTFNEIIVATGSQPIIPDIQGIDSPDVMTAAEVLQGKPTGQNVLVVGAGMVGCETAEFLLAQGKTVTLVEKLSRIAQDIGPTTRWVVVKRIKDSSIKLLTKTSLIGITEKGALTEQEDKKEELQADTIILAVGMTPNRQLARELEQAGFHPHIVGDCAGPGKILEAVHAGWNTGCKI